MTAEPPVFEDRRRISDRRQVDAFVEDESRFLRLSAAAGVAICGGLVVVYLFFAAIGSVDLGAPAAPAVTVLGPAPLWGAGYWGGPRPPRDGAQTAGGGARRRRGVRAPPRHRVVLPAPRPRRP